MEVPPEFAAVIKSENAADVILAAFSALLRKAGETDARDLRRRKVAGWISIFSLSDRTKRRVHVNNNIVSDVVETLNNIIRRSVPDDNINE